MNILLFSIITIFVWRDIRLILGNHKIISFTNYSNILSVILLLQSLIASIISLISINDYNYEVLLLSIYIVLNIPIVMYIFIKILSLKKKLKDNDNGLQLTNINEKTMSVISNLNNI